MNFRSFLIDFYCVKIHASKYPRILAVIHQNFHTPVKSVQINQFSLAVT